MQKSRESGIAAVIVDISADALDRPFEYLIPDSLQGRISVGSAVHIPFGRGNRVIVGYVIELRDTSEWDTDKLKSIIDISEREVSTEGKLIGLAAWMRGRYGGSMNQAIKTVLPMRRGVKSVEKHWLNFLVDEEELRRYIDIFNKKNHKAKSRLLEYCVENSLKTVELGVVSDATKVSKQTVLALEKDGILAITDKKIYRTPADIANISSDISDERSHISLSKQQCDVVDIFNTDYEQHKSQKYLLYGVTGSGKTEVYIEMLKTVTRHHKQAIVLIPEIALTHQTVERLMAVFGDRVSVMHSRLSAGERYDQYERILSGDVDILVGPRSAVFAPFADLGIIIVDEEHERSYISEQTPSYNAIEVAEKRSDDEKIPLVLGSATPSVSSYLKAKNGQYKLFTMTDRIGGASLPKVYVADLREELKARNHSIFSRLLKDKINQRLSRGEQTMLFINRRGYAGFVSCRSCGYVIKCPHCDVSMTAHLRYRKVDMLTCHYCGYTSAMPDVCPECNSPYIAAFGLGTEKVVEMIEKEFPTAKVLRMDADTTKNKNGHEKVLSPFREGEADILVGTQMIVKGHDFPKVTLVGAIAADLSLHEGDYRSSEKTYQLLMQAGGRAGRGELEGEFVIQTYRPDEYCIEAVSNSDAGYFYDKELGFRRLLGYPPYKHMLEILVSSKIEKDACDAIDYIHDILADSDEDISCIGPAPDRIAKVKDYHRRVLYIKSESDESITEVIRHTQEGYLNSRWVRSCRISYDRSG